MKLIRMISVLYYIFTARVFSKCFLYPCLSSFVTSHTNSFITCSNFWRCIPLVMFSCASLFNLDSCKLYRFRLSHEALPPGEGGGGSRSIPGTRTPFDELPSAPWAAEPRKVETRGKRSSGINFQPDKE